jgi:hypothetical protein
MSLTSTVAVVEQPGYGHYPTDWIVLESRYRHHLKGYIQWNTFSSKAGYLTEWTQITLRVSIIDKVGNQSSEVVFPFTFEKGVRSQRKPSNYVMILAKMEKLHLLNIY